MKETSIINGINNYLDEELIPFSMPGHKVGRAFSDIKDNLLRGDLTEVDGLDNLYKPEGIIKEAEDKLTVLYKSKKSYFLVNGSTCGNLIMMFAAFNEGDKVLVERNCHRSIMNGIIMRKLTPVFIKNTFHNKFKVPVGLDLVYLEKILNENDDIKGIVITYPNYYGIGIQLDTIINLCRKKGLKILVDSAHGAHFGFYEELPKSPQELDVDMVVMSAHKTLPSLTQTSWMHINDSSLIEKVDFYKNVFMSTSPSYMFMMSLDYARNFLEFKAKEAYEELLSNIREFKESVKDLSYGTIIDKSYLNKTFYQNQLLEFDESRIIITLDNGLSGHKLLDYLRSKKIQCEMSDNKNVVLIPSPFNTKNDFKKLSDSLLSCTRNLLEDKEIDFYDVEIPSMGILPCNVMEMENEYLNIDDCLGKVVYENIIPYPPGVPLLIMGEIIEQKHIDIMKNYVENSITIMGLYNDKIKVVKNK